MVMDQACIPRNDSCKKQMSSSKMWSSNVFNALKLWTMLGSSSWLLLTLDQDTAKVFASRAWTQQRKRRSGWPVCWYQKVWALCPLKLRNVGVRSNEIHTNVKAKCKKHVHLWPTYGKGCKLNLELFESTFRGLKKQDQLGPGIVNLKFALQNHALKWHGKHKLIDQTEPRNELKSLWKSSPAPEPSNSAQPANQSPSSLCDVHRHNEGHKFLNPRIDGAALLDRLHYGGEVVIRQDPRPTRARAQSNCYYEALYSHLFTVVHQQHTATPQRTILAAPGTSLQRLSPLRCPAAPWPRQSAPRAAPARRSRRRPSSGGGRRLFRRWTWRNRRGWGLKCYQ